MNKVALATPDMPLPTVGIGGKQSFYGTRQIISQLPAIKAFHFVRKNLPPPNILKTFEQILNNLQESHLTNSRSKPMLLVGERGCGKTSAAVMASQLVNGENPNMFDCGGKSLDELLVETIFDENTKPIIETLESRFNGGYPGMSTLARNIIEEKFPETIGENGKLCLANLENKSGSITELQEIAKLEGIGTSGGLGIRFQEGALIRACKAGKMLVIDEVDKALENTGTSLQQVWLAISGQGAAHVVNQNGVNFTFSNETVAPGFSVVLTANNQNDGLSISGLKESTRDRQHIINVDPSDALSIAVRIGQILLAYNFQTIEPVKFATPDVAKTFKDLAELAGDPLTEDQKILMARYPDVIQACQQLGAFYHEWNEAIQPDKTQDPLLDAQRDMGLQPPGPRMAQDHIVQAHHYREIETMEEATPFRGLQSVLEDLKTIKERDEIVIAQGFGQKLEKIVLNAIEDFAGGVDTHRTITQLAIKHGVLPDPDEENNPNPNKRLIRDLLDTLDQTKNIEPATLEMQPKLVALIKKKYPELKNVEPEKVLPIGMLQAAVTKAKEQSQIKRSHSVAYIVGINPNYMTDKEKSPICLVPILDTREKTHLPTIREHIKENLMETQEFMAVVSHEGLRASMLEALWVDAFQEETEGESSAVAKIQTGLDGRNTNIRVARIMTRKEDGTTERIILLQSKTKNKTWMFGENLKSQTSEGLTVEPNPTKLFEEIEKTIGQEAINDIMGAITSILPAEVETEGLSKEEILTKTTQVTTKQGKEGPQTVIGATRIPLKLKEEMQIA